MPITNATGYKDRSVKGKIAAIVAISLAVFIVVLVSLDSWLKNDRLEQQEKASLILSHQLNDFISNIKRTSTSISQNRFVRNRLIEKPELSDNPQDNREINVALYSIKLFSNASIAYVMNAEGMVIASTTYEEGRTLSGNRYAFRPYFREAIKGNNIIYAAVGVTTRERGLYFSSPVFRPGYRQPVGVVVLKVGLEGIDRIIDNFPGHAGILSPEGIVFAVSIPDWLFKAALPLDEQKRDELVKSRQFADQPLNPLLVKLDRDTFKKDGKTYSVVKKDVQIPGWSLFTALPSDLPFPLHWASLVFILIAFVDFLIILNLFSNRQKAKLENDKMLVETEILRQNNFLNSVLNSLTYPLFIINLDDYSIALANKASGFDNMIGKITCYQASHDRDQPCSPYNHTCSTAEVRKNGKPVVIEESHVENGVKKYTEIHAHPIFDSNGKPVQMIKYIMDVTHRKKMEEELVKRRQIESIGILAGGIAHDFNNLLSVIIGNITLVKDELLEGESHYHYLTNAEKAVIKAADLAKKLTTFSRGGWLERETMDIQAIVQQAVTGMPEEEKAEYNIHIEEDLKPVFGDRRQMNQVFQNIFQNAIEAGSKEKGITVTADNVDNPALEMADVADPEEIKHTGFIHIAVKDFGKGINPKDMGKIFNPYFTTKPKGEQKGVGLGLTVCYSIINKHKGFIQVQSEEEKGTTVNIYLPVHTEEEERR